MIEYIQIPPGCPYYGFETTIDLTCEEGLCSWLRQPANVYSSFIFFIPALYIIWYTFKNKVNSLQVMGVTGLFIGISSVMAHTTHLKVFGFADFTFQFFLILVLIWLNLQRTPQKIPCSVWLFSLGVWIPCAVIQWFLMDLSLIVYGVLLTVVLLTELYAFWSTRKGQYWDYAKCAAFLFSGFIVFYLDAFKVICDPNNHVFQLHALWHFLAAASMFYLFRHYLQFYQSK